VAGGVARRGKEGRVMKEWRYPFGKPPEAVFLHLGARSGALDLLEIVSWLDLVLPGLNWRSHLFVIGEEPGSTERATMMVLDLASKHLKRRGFANLTVHPLVSLNGGEESESWDQLVAMVRPFQEEARELLSEARLHIAPILAPSPEVASGQALRAADYFRSRLAIPSFYLAGGLRLKGSVAIGAGEVTFGKAHKYLPDANQHALTLQG